MSDPRKAPSSRSNRSPQRGQRFHRQEGQWSGDIGANTIVTFGLLWVVLVIGSLLTWNDPNVALLAVLAAILVALVVYETRRFAELRDRLGRFTSGAGIGGSFDGASRGRLSKDRFNRWADKVTLALGSFAALAGSGEVPIHCANLDADAA